MGDFYVCSKLPEPFRLADEYMAKKYPQPKTIKKPREVPMPDIKINYGAEGPLKITEKWYVKKKQKQMVERAISQREAEIDMIQYIAKRDMLRRKLAELDPSKKKDSKRIASYNVEIMRLTEEIEQLERQFDISATEIDHGTRVGRFLARCKKGVKKVGKKIKKFCKRNSDLITGIASIVLPVIGSCIMKAIFHI